MMSPRRSGTSVETLKTVTWTALVRLGRAGLSFSPYIDDKLLKGWVSELENMGGLSDDDESYNRLRVAISTIIREDEKWPAMSRVLSAMPQPEPEPEPELSPEQTHENWLAMLDDRFGSDAARSAQATVDESIARVAYLRNLLDRRKKEPMSDDALRHYVHVEAHCAMAGSGSIVEPSEGRLRWYDSHALTRIVRMEEALEKGKTVSDDADLSGALSTARKPAVG